ncbi:MAG: OmpA family protein [Saprospirales bacterium]|nr:OmpA family protein [Saprospirales bacterium]
MKKVEDQYRVSNIEIRGHTSKDQRENEEGSRKLSQLRADMVKQFLIENGVSANKIYAKGYGNDFPNPVYSKDLIHPAHRRVEMKIALISREKKISNLKSQHEIAFTALRPRPHNRSPMGYSSPSGTII